MKASHHPRPAELVLKYLWIVVSLSALDLCLSEDLLGKDPDVASSNCSCNNYEQVFDRLPYFLQDLGRSGQFDFAFQGSKGERGAEGPVGPPGIEGRTGPRGSKGDAGERGPPGLPGASHVSVRSGFFGSGGVDEGGSGGKGEKGDTGAPGTPGKRGQKGERGETSAFVVRDGRYSVVKGEQGDRGRRGRKGEPGRRGEAGTDGLPGAPGLSIQGEKGSKGEPALMPDLDLLRGSQGPRGPPGLPGPPGLRGECGHCAAMATTPKVDNVRVSIPQRGDAGPKGEPGLPGLSLQGEPGPKGDPGIRGPAGESPLLEIVPGALVLEFEDDFFNEDFVGSNVPPGTIAYVADVEKVFIRGKSHWREIPLGVKLLDRRSSEGGMEEENKNKKHYFANSKPTPAYAFPTWNKNSGDDTSNQIPQPHQYKVPILRRHHQ